MESSLLIELILTLIYREFSSCVMLDGEVFDQTEDILMTPKQFINYVEDAIENIELPAIKTDLDRLKRDKFLLHMISACIALMIVKP